MAPTPILVIGDEELFIEFMGRFSPRDNRLLFASDLTEALGHCRTSQPELFVLPLDRNHQELSSILTEAFRLDAQVLGLSSNGGDPPEYVTRLASPGDLEAVYTAAAELLQERRLRPRIRHQLTVDVDGLGSLRSVSLNATSIFVATEAPLDPGVQVTISLRVSDGELSGRAEVTRVGIGEDGNLGMVLVVSPDSATLCHFLESLVRQLLQHEHARQEQSRDLPPAPVAPADPLNEHQISSLNRALDVIVGEVAALREQVQAGQRGDGRLEALERRAVEQQEGLTGQQEQLDGFSGRLERLRLQQAALDEALAQRADEAEGDATRFDRLEAAIEAAQKSASYVEESRAGFKGRLEQLERGRAGLNESLELQGEQATVLGAGLKELERGQADLDKTTRSQGDQLVALGSGLEQVAEIAASSGLTLEEKKKEILSQVEQAQEAIREELATLSGRVEVTELAQEQGRDELKQGFEALGGDLQRVEERAEQQETLSAEAKTEAREALSQQIELTHAALQALERSIGQQDEHLEALGDRVEALSKQISEVQQTFGEVRDEVSDLMEALATRVEEVAEASAPAEALERLVKGFDAVGQQQEQLNKTLAEQNKVVVKLVQRLDRIEG